MVNVHHLDNLIWVWNQNGPAPPSEFGAFFPGQKFFDVASYDNYSGLSDRYYYEIMALADGKPVALGEAAGSLGSAPSGGDPADRGRADLCAPKAGARRLLARGLRRARDSFRQTGGRVSALAPTACR